VSSIAEEQMSTKTVPEPVSSLQVREFEQMYREYAPLVNRTAWGVLENREDAEDVLHTVFLKLLRKGFPPEFHTNPRPYFYRAAVNVSLDVLKARRRHPTIHPVELEHVEAVHPSSAHFDEETHQQVYAAIGELPEESAEILVLRHMQNKSTTEIMEMLGVSRAVVAVRLFRARARLRKLLRVSKRRLT
jgi:RNA polymerase sigma-70 factor (ECF subfamily)